MPYPPLSLAERKGLSVFRKEPTQSSSQQPAIPQQIQVKHEPHQPQPQPSPAQIPALQGTNSANPFPNPLATASPANTNTSPASASANRQGTSSQPAQASPVVAPDSSPVRTGIRVGFQQGTSNQTVQAAAALVPTSSPLRSGVRIGSAFGVYSGQVSKPSHQPRIRPHYGCSQHCHNKPHNYCANSLCRSCCQELGYQNCNVHDPPVPQEYEHMNNSYPY